jgi:hypothetical protein
MEKNPDPGSATLFTIYVKQVHGTGTLLASLIQSIRYVFSGPVLNNRHKFNGYGGGGCKWGRG